MKTRALTPRALAISVLARVEATDAFLNVVLDAALEETGFRDVRDAGLATELCYGATRRRLTIDACLQAFSERRLETLEDKVLAALRIGVYQLRFMRVPSHAAVGDTVEALKLLGLGRAAGFANAILRKVAGLAEVPVPGDEAERLAVLESHPAWLVRRWLRQFGPERARQMLAANNEAPPLVMRANTTRTTREALVSAMREMGLEAQPTALSEVGLTVKAPGRVESLYGFAEGLWQVQDEAAQLVGLYAQAPAGATVLDVCAAPGGKACHLAERHVVLACDLHENKLHKIRSEAERLGLSPRLTTRQLDASKPFPEGLGEFDAVMVDAPCSGLGTLRRHPELRYRRKETDLAELAALQRAILSNAQAHVKPGGLLVYAVCSVDSSEGPDQVELFLRSHPEFTAEPPKGLAALPTWQGHLRTLPGPEGLDGFFAARLRRMY